MDKSSQSVSKQLNSDFVEPCRITAGMTRRRQPAAIAPPSCSRYSLYRAAVCYITLRYETHCRFYSALQITEPYSKYHVIY